LSERVIYRTREGAPQWFNYLAGHGDEGVRPINVKRVPRRHRIAGIGLAIRRDDIADEAARLRGYSWCWSRVRS